MSSTPVPEATIIPTTVITATPIEEPYSGAVATNLQTGAVMVYVPSGEFMMGSESGESNESPTHSVYLDRFWIYQTEVTNSMYQKCVRTGVCSVPDKAQNFHYYDLVYGDHPMVYVNWNDSDIYCQWAGGRLPSEAEWEMTARGTEGANIYPWGDDLPSGYYANYGAIVGDTMPVGSYPTGQSPYGLLDMTGNAVEWVEDWYDAGYYVNSPSENPSGPDNGLERVLRGGSWNNSEINIMVTKRSSELPYQGSDPIGFRCVSSQLP